jgi:hypothetical protein
MWRVRERPAQIWPQDEDYGYFTSMIDEVAISRFSGKEYLLKAWDVAHV